MSKEELMQAHLRYLSDRRIATLLNEIAAIYSRSIPQMIVKDSSVTVSIGFSPSVEYEVSRVKMILAEYIQENYRDLFPTIKLPA